MNNIYYLAHGGPGSGRYPLGSGNRPYQKFEKPKQRSSSGIRDYIKSRKAKKAEEKAQKAKYDELKRQLEEEKQRQLLKADKERVLRAGKASEVLRYQGQLTNQELQNVINRINLEADLRELSGKEIQSSMSKIDAIMKDVKTATGWITTATDTYNALAAIYNATEEGKKNPLTLVKKGEGGGKKK